MKSIYLDYAAATPLDKRVYEVMRPYFLDKFANPSAIYLAGRQVRAELESARAEIAKCLGLRPAEIIFCSGATEANNLAISGLMSRFPDGEIITSAIEHESVLAPARQFNHQIIPVESNGRIILNKLSKLVSPKTTLISIGLVNNELGTIQPIREVSQLVKQIRSERLAVGNDWPLYLHTDAAQAGNYLDLHVSRLGCDLLSLNGGKIYGPKQSGALYIKAGVHLDPIIRGGGQEFGLRSGTENLAAAVGLAEALKISQAQRDTETSRISKLRKDFEHQLEELLPGATINGGNRRAPHITSLTLAGHDNERLMMELDEKGISVAVGSACSASTDKPSHVLAAIGLPAAIARSTLRLSFGRQTTQSELEATAKAITQITSV